MDILSRAPNFNQPKIFKRSDLFSLVGLTTLNCNATLSNQKQWLIYQVDEQTGLVVQQLTLSLNPTVNFAELVIQPQTLLSGLYRFVYVITMTFTTVISSQVDTFIKITPSGILISSLSLLQPMYGGTIEITRGWNQIIQFNPFLKTYDTDSLCVITSLTFKYACQTIDSNSPNGYPFSDNRTIHLDEFKASPRWNQLLQCFNSTGILTFFVTSGQTTILGVFKF